MIIIVAHGGEVEVLGRGWEPGARWGPRRLRLLFKCVLFCFSCGMVTVMVACAQAQGQRTAAALASDVQAAVAALRWWMRTALPSPAQGT